LYASSKVAKIHIGWLAAVHEPDGEIKFIDSACSKNKYSVISSSIHHVQQVFTMQYISPWTKFQQQYISLAVNPECST
jgi:hypothetical protein